MADHTGRFAADDKARAAGSSLWRKVRLLLWLFGLFCLLVIAAGFIGLWNVVT